MLGVVQRTAADIIDDLADLGIDVRWSPDTDVRCYPRDMVAKELMHSMWEVTKQHLDAIRVRLMALWAVRWVN